MRVLLANPGVQHAFRLAGEFHRRGTLSRFHTAFAMGEDSWLAKTPAGWLPRRVGKALRNRTVPGVPAALVRSHPLLEARALMCRRFGGRDSDAFRARNEAFQRAIPEAEISDADVIVGTDTASEILAERATAAGKPFLLSRSIGEGRAWNAVAQQIRERWPGWCGALDDKRPEALASEDREHDRSRLIVVPGRFVARTLQGRGIPQERIRINPFGCSCLPSLGERDDSGRVIFLFAGTISARKGVPVLLDAWRRIDGHDAELWLAGPNEPPHEALTGTRGVRWLGALSRDQLAEIYREARVFVFPSLFEGFAKVLGEAAGAGLPLIATPASGAEEIVVDGENGFLVPAGDSDALEAKMRWCLQNRDRLPAMGRAARATAERLTWEAYGERWAGVLAEVLCVGREVLAASD